MKKILFSVLAAAALVACAKSEVHSVEETSQIVIKPSTFLATKANVNGVIDGTTYPTAENFDVYGYWSADWTTEKAPANYLLASENSGVEFEYDSALAAWTGVVNHYWPKDGSLKFACYSPATENLKHDWATDTYSKDEFTYTVDPTKTFDLLVAPTTAAYTVAQGSAPVEVAFDHALAWISFKVMATSDDAAEAFTIHDVIVNDVCINADFTADMKNEVITWSEIEDKQAFYVLKEGAQNPVNGEVNTIGTTTQCIVIPQKPTTVTINYTQNELEGSAELKNQSITLPLTIDNNGSWLPGKHYIYTLTFSLEEILIKPVVNTWEPVEQTIDEDALL